MTHLYRLFKAAGAIEQKTFRRSIEWELNNGCENAADTLGDVSPESEEYSDIAVRTVGSILCEHSFTPYGGGTADQIREWFFSNGVSF